MVRAPVFWYVTPPVKNAGFWPNALLDHHVTTVSKNKQKYPFYSSARGEAADLYPMDLPHQFHILDQLRESLPKYKCSGESMDEHKRARVFRTRIQLQSTINVLRTSGCYYPIPKPRYPRLYRWEFFMTKHPRWSAICSCLTNAGSVAEVTLEENAQRLSAYRGY